MTFSRPGDNSRPAVDDRSRSHASNQTHAPLYPLAETSGRRFSRGGAMRCARLVNSSHGTLLSLASAFVVMSLMTGCSGEGNPIYQSISGQQDEAKESKQVAEQSRTSPDQPTASSSSGNNARPGWNAQENSTQSHSDRYSSPQASATGRPSPAPDYSNLNRGSDDRNPVGGSAGGESPPNVAPPSPGRNGRNGGFSGGGQPTGGSNNGGNNNGGSQVGGSSNSGSGRFSGGYADTFRITETVSLPQTGPNGTLMSFTVGYSVSGRLESNTLYFLVILSDQGHREEWQLTEIESDGDSVTAFVDGWRPEYGPYTAVIESQYGTNRNREEVSSRARFP